MRAVTVRELGELSNASLGEVADPVPGQGQVLVEVHAAPVNFADLLTIAGKYQVKPELPFTPGKSPAGIVRSTGPGVTRLKIKDRVLALASLGGYAELIAVDEALCTPLPDAVSFTEASAMSLAFDTAWIALRD